MVEMHATPQDRERFDVYISDISRDHKRGPDGNLVEVHKITVRKQGTNNYEHVWEVGRLKKEVPDLWKRLGPIYEGWLKDNTITREGFPLASWPAITKGQLKACNDLGLQVVEELAEATDTTREKLGMGALELIRTAQQFIATKEKSATANRVATLEEQVASLEKSLRESQATIDALMAEKGQKPQKPNLKRAEAA